MIRSEKEWDKLLSIKLAREIAGAGKGRSLQSRLNLTWQQTWRTIHVVDRRHFLRRHH